MKIKTPFIIFAFSLISLGAGCSKDAWRGFYYPDRSDLTRDFRSDNLNSLEECREWVDEKRASLRILEGEDDYECGRNCKYKSDWDMYICEETVD